MAVNGGNAQSHLTDQPFGAPSISLPKGGGALRGVDEKLTANPATGAASLSVPLPTSPARDGFDPQLTLVYNSGAGNGPFGLGWSLDLAAITRKTDKGLPRYRDAEESDVFILSGAEDLVPRLGPDGSRFEDTESAPGYTIHRYRPRIEGLFARIERWTRQTDGDVHWRTISPDNVLTVYGKDANSRIADPDDPTRVFSWLICETRDDKGNGIVYDYKAEDGAGIDLTQAHERHRGGRDDPCRTANRYIKRVRYGNRRPLLDESGRRPLFLTPADVEAAGWMFDVVFDYGEHDADRPLPYGTGQWPCRPDPFSSYRAGFEVRTYRLCQRVLLFHHFPDEPGVGENCLVRSTDFTYSSDSLRWLDPLQASDRPRPSGSPDSPDVEHPAGPDRADHASHDTAGHRAASFLVAVSQSGYVRTGEGDGGSGNGGDIANGESDAAIGEEASAGGGEEGASGGYRGQSLPPLEFSYGQPVIHHEVREVDPESLENLPIGLDGFAYQWVDLDGEGISGVLTEQAGAWYYKPGLGDGRFGPARPVARTPSGVALNGPHQQLLDLSGSGQLHLAAFHGPLPGFFRRTDREDWDEFRPFDALPNIDWDDPHLRFIDLDGDGRADVLITGDDAFTWYPSLAENGFGPARDVASPLDDEDGPRLVFADGTQSVYLADMSGDGLTDLVRVTNGEICYWPNLGYGRFGAKVTMDGAPTFDHPDQFSQERIHLADIDGSGTTDILYLGPSGVDLYFNESGNRWSGPHRLPAFPHVDILSAAAVVDLLGNGTACLVWSSPLPDDGRRALRYIDLMGGTKPHLLIGFRNNLGAETRISFAPSTKFYLADKLAGKPWRTKLPFPVHVVEEVEHRDYISGSRFVTRYAYHHGYYDGEEREFRGFGMVEQWDAETFDHYVSGVNAMSGRQDTAAELSQPPVTTRSWFHTGACGDEGGSSLGLTGTPPGLNGSLPGSNGNFPGSHGSLLGFEEEYYGQKRHLDEPVLPAGLDAVGWRDACRALKGQLLRQEVYSFDGSPEEDHPYQVVERRYEVMQVQPRAAGNRHAVWLPVLRESVSIQSERQPADPRISHSLVLEVDEYGNPRKECAIVYGRQMADPALPDAVRNDQARSFVTYSETDYTHDIDRSGPVPAYRLRVPYESRSYEVTGIAPADHRFSLEEVGALIAAAEEIPYEATADGSRPQKRLLSRSRTLFRDDHLNALPPGQWDTLGLPYQSYRLAFTQGVIDEHYAGAVSDADFRAAGYVRLEGEEGWWIPSGTAIYPEEPDKRFFLPIGTRDPLGLERVATFDRYHLLLEKVSIKQAPWCTTTAKNDYRVLGPVMLTDPNKNRSAVEHDALGMVVRSAVMGKEGAGEGDTLDDPTARMEYELFNWMRHRKPNFVRSLVREAHGPDNPRWQETYTYSNGSGGVALVKAQVRPGPALASGPDGSVTEVEAAPRWIGNGRTVLNNKGNPVKAYEPYFSTTHEYEDEAALREVGVTPVHYYDAVGRNVRTELPNGTLTRVQFDPWRQRVFDANDTVTESRWYAERGSPDPTTEAEPVGDPQRRAAWLTAKHAGTPAVVHFDALGRAVYAVSDYGGGKRAAVRSVRDFTGRHYQTFDQEGREVASGFVGMTGMPVVAVTAEKGRRWTFFNVLGALVRSWDEHGRHARVAYDELHRPLGTYLRQSGQAERLVAYIVYGDGHPDAEQRNLLGVAHQRFDQAGVVTVPQVDFKGNPIRVERTLAREYREEVDWSELAHQPDYASIQTAAGSALELAEVFVATCQYDALDRPTRVTLPDGTVVVPRYDEGNALVSLRAQIRGQGEFFPFLKDQRYDAKGQKQFAHHGNDVLTRFFYDPATFRLTNLLVHREGDEAETQALQNIFYTYDPAGNITQVRDEAQPTHFFNNAVVRPESLYEYDANYRLIRATGREHVGLGNDGIRTHADLELVTPLPHPNDRGAVRTYTEEYEYDLLGNLRVLRHRYASAGGSGNGWTLRHRYAYEDDPSNGTNRLAASRQPGDAEAGPYSGTYQYDPYGNMVSMPHLSEMEWNGMDQLRRVDLGGGGTTYFVYGASGQRIRKVTERNGSTVLEWIFLGALLLFRRRRRRTGEVRFERWTVHIGDDHGPIAQVDTKTVDEDGRDPDNPLGKPLIRYQYTNHLGSSTLETDEDGVVISYEEYHPYGTTAYRSARPGTDGSLKRFRFSGKERDDETGLYYFGARYYAPWLARWTSSDPAGFADGLNIFAYARNNPINRTDPTGTQSGVTVVKERHFTGRESFEDLQKIPIPEGYEWDPAVTPENYREYWHPGSEPGGAGGVWAVLREAQAGGSVDGDQDADDAPGGIVANAVRALIAAIQDANQPRTSSGEVLGGPLNLWSGPEPDVDEGYKLRDTRYQEAIERELEATRVRKGVRTVDDLDYISVQRPIWAKWSHRLAREGALSGRGVMSHGLEPGLHPDPAGTVQREVELPAVRRWGGAMAALGAASGLLTMFSASQFENRGVRYFGYAAGAGEIAGALTYGWGLARLGQGILARGATSAQLMRRGTLMGRFAGGPGMVIMSGYSAIVNVQTENYGVVLGDVAGVVSGAGVIAGSLPVAGIAGGIAITNAGGDFIESVVTPEFGRAVGVATGTAAGAAAGAAIGAAIGVWGFGFMAAPSAAVGAVIGGIAGFIGAFW